MLNLVGIVINKKTEKTAIVAVFLKKIYSKYNKKKNILKKYMVHDEDNISKIGDIVTILPCNPKSKKKRWNIIKFI